MLNLSLTFDPNAEQALMRVAHSSPPPPLTGLDRLVKFMDVIQKKLDDIAKYELHSSVTAARRRGALIFLSRHWNIVRVEDRGEIL